MNFLASPPLVVAYALTGTMKTDLYNDPLGFDSEGAAIYLSDIWPSSQDIQELIAQNVDAGMFNTSYSSVFDGDENNALKQIGELIESGLDAKNFLNDILVLIYLF